MIHLRYNVIGPQAGNLPVEVYRNLRRNCWSVRHRGRVFAYADTVVIEDARFVVQPAGNRRVRETGRKNVHAFIRGNMIDLGGTITPFRNAKGSSRGRIVSYNPHANTSFVLPNGGSIFEARTVVLCEDMKVRVP